MQIKDRIDSDLKEALKNGDTFSRDVLRMLVSDIKNKGIDTKEELTEEDLVAIVKRNIKSRKDSIDQFVKGGREDLAQKEKSEVAILERYMPEQLSAEQIQNILDKVLSNMDDSDSKNFGLVMKEVMSETQGRADGAEVSEIVRKALAN